MRLLDARVLSKDLQMAGITMLRKIIEVENLHLQTPAADWDTDDWVEYRRIVKIKQDSLTERGTIQFLCKHIAEQEDASSCCTGLVEQEDMSLFRTRRYFFLLDMKTYVLVQQ